MGIKSFHQIIKQQTLNTKLNKLKTTTSYRFIYTTLGVNLFLLILLLSKIPNKGLVNFKI